MAGCESPSSETARTLRAALNPSAAYAVGEVSRFPSLARARAGVSPAVGRSRGRGRAPSDRFLGFDLLRFLEDEDTPSQGKPR